MADQIYPSPQECAELADRFFAGQKSFLPDRGWSLLSDQERTRIVEERMAAALKRTEAPAAPAAPSRPRERVVVEVRNLDHFVAKLEKAGKDAPVSSNTLALAVKMLQEELSAIFTEQFNKALLNIRKETDDNWHWKYQAKLTQVETLKEERDYLKYALEEKWKERRRPEMKLVNSDE